MEKGIRNLREKMKHMNKNQWLILVLTGILLLVIAMPVPEKSSEKKAAKAVQTEAVGEGGDMETLEKRLEYALASVEGVGRVRVMITKKSSGEKIVEKDIPVTDRSTTEEGGDGNRSTVEKTQEEATVYVQDGNGGQTPYVIRETEPQIQGIVVVAEGGNDPKVVRNITEAVMALFGVEVHKIKVMKMN